MDTPYTRTMNQEDRKVLEGVEAREIYANFNESDKGRSRQLIATCISAKCARNIIKCREIVRRLAEPQFMCLNEMEAIIQDADRLWAKMQKEAKGGDDNGKG